MFSVLWSGLGSGGGGARGRLWVLRLLRDGLKTKSDTALLSRGHVFSVLMSTMLCRGALDAPLRHAIVDIFDLSVSTVFSLCSSLRFLGGRVVGCSCL